MSSKQAPKKPTLQSRSGKSAPQAAADTTGTSSAAAKPNPHLTPMRKSSTPGSQKQTPGKASSSVEHTPKTAAGSSATKASRPVHTPNTKVSATASKHSPVKHTSAAGKTAAAPKEVAKREEVEEPEPVETLSTKVLSKALLQQWTGWEDLDLVLTATFKIDAEEMVGVQQLPEMLPRATSLRLSGSRVPQVRALGTKFNSLKYLWLNHSNVESVQGIGVLAPNLAELYLAFNRLKDLTPLMYLSETLEVLDLEGNEVSDPRAAGNALAALKKLKVLTLQGNPVVRSADLGELVRLEDAPEVKKDADKGRLGRRESVERVIVYRQWIRQMLPDVVTLDDFPMDEEAEATPATAAEGPRPTSRAVTTSAARAVYFDPMDEALAEELRLVQECVRQSSNDTLEKTVDGLNKDVYDRPSTSCAGARRTNSATASGNSTTAAPARPTESSNLTTGNVFAGSAIASLRKRGKTPPAATTDKESSTTSATAAAKAKEEASDSKPDGVHLVNDDEDETRALFDSNDAEEEYDKYKAELLRKRFTDGSRGTSAASSRRFSVEGGPATAASRPESSSLRDVEVFKEVGRTKTHIARGGSATVEVSAETTNFIDNADQFEVLGENETSMTGVM